MKKILILIIVFYFLVLLQTSFLVYFNISGIIPNLVLISVILINLFQKPENPSGLYSAVCGGFFLDIFSGRPIGFWILMLLLTSIFIQKIFKNYVRIPFAERT